MKKERLVSAVMAVSGEGEREGTPFPKIMLTNPRDAFIGQSRSPKLGMVS